MYTILSILGEKLNRSNIVWAVGGSILLNQFDLIDKPNDIDLFVDINQIEKVDDIFKRIGQKKEVGNDTTFSTRYFYEYIVEGINIDVMAGFAVNHSDGLFEYIFDDHSISEFRLINGVSIPFTSLEDWYVIYHLIPDREYKANMIRNYLLSNGINQYFLLERALEANLPLAVRKKVEMILS